VNSTAINHSQIPSIARGFRLQWEAAQNAHVLLYPEGMVKLNGSAGEILSRCNGALTIEKIVADLEQMFGQTGLHADVANFLALARARGWVELREESDGGDGGDESHEGDESDEGIDPSRST
jgi:pyrroloquinoline quinone biosynthesis protein D